MNLHGMASAAIGMVNPFVIATHRRSTGYTTSSTGARLPTYAQSNILVQVQALTFSDLQHIEGQNQQGVQRSVYLNGAAFAVVRPLQIGGDQFVFAEDLLPEGRVWLVTHSIEQWPDWCKVVITLQKDAAP